MKTRNLMMLGLVGLLALWSTDLRAAPGVTWCDLPDGSMACRIRFEAQGDTYLIWPQNRAKPILDLASSTEKTVITVLSAAKELRTQIVASKHPSVLVFSSAESLVSVDLDPKWLLAALGTGDTPAFITFCKGAKFDEILAATRRSTVDPQRAGR